MKTIIVSEKPYMELTRNTERLNHFNIEGIMAEDIMFIRNKLYSDFITTGIAGTTISRIFGSIDRGITSHINQGTFPKNLTKPE